MGRFLSAYETWFAKTTDAPLEFGHAGGLMVLSTLALGRRWMPRGTGQIRPNLNVILTADSSRDRKSTSVGAAIKVLREVEPKRVGPEDFTAEGVISHMRHRPGTCTHNRIILPLEEFGTYLAAAQQSYSQNLSAAMCRLYDGNTFERARSGKKTIKIKDPLLSIFGGVAYGMLEKYTNPQEWTTGFFARIVFVTPVQRRPEIIPPPPPAPTEFAIAVDEAKRIRLNLKATKGPMHMDQAAINIYKGYVSSSTVDDAEDPAVIAQRERLNNAVLKLAMLYQIDIDHAKPIGAQAMDAATQFGTRAWVSFKLVRSVTAGTPMSRLIRRMWKLISAAGPDGITRRDLYHGCHFTVDEMLPVLNILMQSAVVTTTVFKGAKGPSAHGYKVLIPYNDVHDA